MPTALQDETPEAHHGRGAVCAGGVRRGRLAGFGCGQHPSPGFFERAALQHNFKESTAGVADEKARVLAHVGYRGLEAAVRGGDARIEVEGLRREFGPGAKIAA